MTNKGTRLTGRESLRGAGVPDVELLDFWQWAFSDLRFNDVRGTFAEWLVAKLLGLELPPRESWGDYDLVTPEGVKIEVKASAYLQAWEQKSPSRIVFNRLKGQTWKPIEGYAETRTYNADLYIFCVQVERDPTLWNALDLDQWRFYVLTRQHLALRDTRSISLAVLERLAEALTGAQLVTEVARLVEQRQKS